VMIGIDEDLGDFEAFLAAIEGFVSETYEL
jgi:hypothetical protein